MKKITYFEVVDSKINWELNERYATESEALEALAEITAEGGCPNPLHIRKTVCTMNAKGKTIRKDKYDIMG